VVFCAWAVGFRLPTIASHIDNSNAEGCHHLIREGATLIYHPQQVIEDVNSQLAYGRLVRQAERLSNSPVSSTTDPRSEVQQPSHAMDKDRAAATDNSQLLASNIKSQRSAISVPAHLTAVYEQLDWHGQDLDALIIATGLIAPQLIGQLMELELLGVIHVQGGRYLRV